MKTPTSIFPVSSAHRVGLISLLLLVVLGGFASNAHAQLSPENESLERATERMREAVQRIVVPPSALTNGPSVRAAFQEVVAQPNTWTVRVKCDGKDASLGTIVTPEGHILTKASQISGQVTCRLFDGRELAGNLVGIKPEFDLAIVKVEADSLPVVTWEDNLLHLGQWLATPGQQKTPASIGVLSVMAREIPKESGYLGIVLEQGDGGAKVTQVMPDSGAASAGVLIDDIVTHCNGARTEDREKLIRTVRQYGPGEEVALTVRRGDKEVTLSALLSRSIQGWRPDRREVQNTMGGKLSERRQGFPSALQHDTVLDPADCGGPVVDLDGRAVGINVARAGRTETFAIPAATVKALLPELLSGKLMSVRAETPAEVPPPPKETEVEEGTPPEPVE
jgi:serine protease Do